MNSNLLISFSFIDFHELNRKTISFWVKIVVMRWLCLPIILCLCISSCEDLQDAKDALGDGFVTEPDPIPGSTTDNSDLGGECRTDFYGISEDEIVRKLDILIVPDTSGSIKKEREAIASGLDHFVQTLPSEIDFRIGVMLAHGSRSVHHSRLYKKSSGPLVLDSEIHSLPEIKSFLKDRMQNPVTDNYSDGGEMGLFSLFHSLSGEKLEEIKREGLMRDDAALAIIFVTDEQDICFDYPPHIQGVVDPNGSEISSKARDCSGISANSVWNKLKKTIGDRPVVVGGIVYNNIYTIPFSGENELGHGILDMIELAGGLSVDLANGSYRQGLTNLGRLASAKLIPESRFNLQLSPILESSIQVEVGGISADFTFDTNLNQVELVHPRDPFALTKVSYCTPKPETPDALDIATGGFHTCAILAEGQVKCWGRNQFGQLGLGDTIDRGIHESPQQLPALSLPLPVIELSAGLYHTCALLVDQSVRCWGDNSYGQLGQGHVESLGDNENLSEILPVSLGGPVRKIYAGTRHNCALLQSNEVRCWGNNSGGELGLGMVQTIGDDELPSEVSPVPLAAGAVQMDLSTISSHSCAVLVDGRLQCWGKNSFGQLGLGHLDDVGDDEGPQLVDVGNSVLQIATGNTHTCVLLKEGRIKCWGANLFGQVGSGDAAIYGDDEAPTQIPLVDFNLPMQQVSAGNFSSCAIDLHGKVRCWGNGQFGKLGYGDVQNVGLTGLPKDAGTLKLPGEVGKIVAGINHTCALFKVSGKVKCWGQAIFGQLGLGATEDWGDDEDLSQLPFVLLTAGEVKE